VPCAPSSMPQTTMVSSVATAAPNFLILKTFLLLLSSHVALLRDPPLRIIIYEASEKVPFVVNPPWMKTVLSYNAAVCPNVPSGAGATVGYAVTCEMQTMSAANVKSVDIIVDVSCKGLYVQG